MESAAAPTERDTRAAARSSAHSSSSSEIQDSDSAIADTSSTTPNPTSSALTPAQLLAIMRDIVMQTLDMAIEIEEDLVKKTRVLLKSDVKLRSTNLIPCW